MLWLGIRIFNSSIISMLQRVFQKTLQSHIFLRLCLPVFYSDILTMFQVTSYGLLGCSSQPGHLVNELNEPGHEASPAWPGSPRAACSHSVIRFLADIIRGDIMSVTEREYIAMMADGLSRSDLPNISPGAHSVIITRL